MKDSEKIESVFGEIMNQVTPLDRHYRYLWGRVRSMHYRVETPSLTFDTQVSSVRVHLTIEYDNLLYRVPL